MKSSTIPSLVGLLCAATLSAADSEGLRQWPQWRGPLATGAAPEANPPTTWSESEHVKWKTAIPGEGSSTPIVWGNRIFVQSAISTGKKPEAAGGDNGAPPTPGGGRGFGFSQKPTEILQFTVLCIDRATGKVLWQKVAKEEMPHEGKHPSDGSYAAPSPISDGKLLIAPFGSRGIFCYDFDGNLKWSQDLGDMRIAMSFGEGSSPALVGNRVIVNWDNEGESFIAGLDKQTGKIVWKTPREERTSWATPLVVDVGGKPQVVTAATRKIRSYDPETGKLVWECSGLTPNVIPTPVAGNGMLYALSGYRGNALLAIKLGQTGDLSNTDAIAWKHNKATPYVPSPLLAGESLYFLSGNNPMLSCFDAKSGAARFESERLANLNGVYASPVAAAGKIYVVGRNGSVAVLKQSEKLEVLATNKLEDGFDASPALVGSDLILRGKKNLYCIAEK